MEVNKRVKFNTHHQITLITSILVFFLLLSPALATTESFIESEANLVTWSQTDTPQAAYLRINNITFQEVSSYQNLLQVILSVNQDYLLDGGAPNSAATTCTIRDGADIIGTGNIGYGKLGTNDLNVYLYLDTWNIGSRTGAANFSIDHNYSKIYNLKLHNWTSRPAGTDKLGFYWSNATTFTFSHTYYVYHDAFWQNDYTYTVDGSLYHLNINKTLGGKAYNSTWIVTSPSREWLNETGIPSSDNNSITMIDAPVTLTVYSNYDNLHTDIIFTPEAGDNTVSGFVLDAKNGYSVSGATIQLDGVTYTTSGLSGNYSFSVDSGTYLLNCSKSGYDSLVFNLTIDNNLNLNLPLTPIPDTPINESILYGQVIEYSTGDSINSAYITVSNDSYEASTYTTINGYFEFDDLIVDVYDVEAEKSGYYSQYREINITSINTSTYALFELVNIALIPTVTETPAIDPGDKTKEALKNLFRMVGIPEALINFFLALLLIIACIIIGYKTAKEIGAILCGLAAFLISVAINWLPLWLALFFVLIAGAYIVKTMMGGGGGGD